MYVCIKNFVENLNISKIEIVLMECDQILKALSEKSRVHFNANESSLRFDKRKADEFA